MSLFRAFLFLKIEDILNNLCFIQECIDWAKDERRTFLRQSLESRLIGLYFETERFTDALALGATLLKELKKLDDKNLLVEVILSVISVDYPLCSYNPLSNDVNLITRSTTSYDVIAMTKC